MSMMICKTATCNRELFDTDYYVDGCPDCVDEGLIWCYGCSRGYDKVTADHHESCVWSPEQRIKYGKEFLELN